MFLVNKKNALCLIHCSTCLLKNTIDINYEEKQSGVCIMSQNVIVNKHIKKKHYEAVYNTLKSVVQQCIRPAS